ncbi:MAG: hypothetical protein ACE5E7_16185 [Anaerolineae bacterium]
MSLASRFRPGNALIRQVRRHAAMATLFRTAAPLPAATPPRTDGPIARAIVRADLVTLPMGQVMDLPPVMATAPPPLAWDETMISRPAAVQTAADSPLPAVSPPRASPPPPEPPKPKKSEDDPEWDRLSLIMRKHQEKQAQESREAAAEVEALNSSDEALPRSPTPPTAEIPSASLSREDEEAAAPAKPLPPLDHSMAPTAKQTGAKDRDAEPAGSVTSDTPRASVSTRAEPGNGSPLHTAVSPKSKARPEVSRLTSDQPGAGGSLPVEASTAHAFPAKQDALVGDSIGETAAAQGGISGGEDADSGAKPHAGDNVIVGDDVVVGRSDAPAPVAEAAATPVMRRFSDDTANDDTANDDTAKDDTAKDDTAKDDTAKDDSANINSANIDPVGGEAAAGKAMGAWDNAPAGREAMTAAPEPAGAQGPVQREAEAPLPLQAAWPVERKIPVPASQPAPVAEPALSPLRPPDEVAAESRRVQRALHDVEAGQPTDSSVELVLPRRPRPSAASDAARTFQAERERGDSDTPATPEAPDTVPTEIGPLPADLWQLLGQEPPTKQKAPDMVTRAIAAAEAPAKPAALAWPEVEDTRQVIPPPVQRTAAPAEEAVAETPASTAESPPASPQEAAAEEGEAAEIDVDELARRVFGQLKRRLSVEWERARGRF